MVASIPLGFCPLSRPLLRPSEGREGEGDEKEQPLGCVFALFTKTFIVTETTSLF